MAACFAPTPSTEDERDYLSERDSFYLATVSETGWPYVQFRGGPPGFLRVLDEHTRGWADSAGLEMPGYDAVRRAVVVTVEAYDWNCQQHIRPRFTVAELKQRPSQTSVS